MRHVLVFLVVAALVSLLGVFCYEKGRSEANAWRSLYLRAEADAKVVNCVALDNNYFMCEKEPHAQR